MAGLTKDKNDRHIVQFTLGTRRTISLGRIPKATAQKVHRHIEDLIAANALYRRQPGARADVVARVNGGPMVAIALA